MLLLDSTDRPNWLTSDMNWREAVETSAASTTASSAASSAVSSAAALFVCAAPRPYSLSTALCPLLFVGCVGTDGAHGVQRHPSSNKCVPTFRCLWSLALDKTDSSKRSPDWTNSSYRSFENKTADRSLDVMLSFVIAKVCNHLSPLFNNISSWFVKNNISSWLVNLCEPLRPSVTADKKEKRKARYSWMHQELAERGEATYITITTKITPVPISTRRPAQPSH